MCHRVLSYALAPTDEREAPQYPVVSKNLSHAWHWGFLSDDDWRPAISVAVSSFIPHPVCPLEVIPVV